MDKINWAFEKGYDMEREVIYFPVRHHSPACSYHVKKAIELYKPEAVLIEGIEEGNDLLPLLSHDDIVAPFATYHSFVDKKGAVGEKGERYKFYTPYMDSSPELTAIREGKKRGLEVAFIDMPMPYHLIDHKKEFNYNTYEKYITFNNKYIETLCRKEGCQDYEELWEKLFELDYMERKHEDFVRNLLSYCILTREAKLEELDSENLMRESYMAMKIREYKEKFNRILVITGGYHTVSLLKMSKEFVKPFEYDKEDLNIYPLAYSYDRLDGMRTYASGMPYPEYYNRLCLGMDSGKNHEDIAKEYFLETIRELRKGGEGISTADGIEALYMAEELRKLRNKGNIGAAEIREAVLSSFVKGAINLSTGKPLEILDRKMRGNGIGRIPSTSVQPPVITDFRNQAEELGLNLDKLVKKQVTLDLYRKRKDKGRSAFLHMLQFLQVPFGKLVKSANLLNTDTRGTMREVWEVAWSVETETILLDLSVYGTSLKEVTENILYEKIKESEKVGEICTLLSTSYYCGLKKEGKKIFEAIREIIEEDNSFTSQGQGSAILHFLYQAADLLEVEDKDKLYVYMKETYDKSLYLFSLTEDIDQARQEEFGEAINKLYSLTLDNNLNFDRERFIENLLVSLEKVKNSYMQGVISALLYTLGAREIGHIVSLFKSHIYASTANVNESVDYLVGIFTYGREVIFIKDEFITELNNLISSLDKEKFMSILPKLRRAFTFYTPLEINRIGEKIGKIAGNNPDELLLQKGIDEEVLELALRLDKIGKERVEGIFELSTDTD